MAWFDLAQIVEGELVNLRNRVRPIGVDAKAVHVADDEKGRVLQSQGVLLKLREGGVEVFALALVFTPEEAALPDVGPAVAAGRLAGATLESEPFAGRIGVSRPRLAEHGAQVVEMALSRRTLFQLGGFPFGDKGFRRH
ncbi:hypothetical protein GJ654_20070 [Rhodoblastus acidophilus]|uniref:Uncharacterized protein n=1 Tax=Rhodoblastus acidophilus TaxID=1074 RepID=A0A6N8DS94_RHOAC|nr:hypothetical protein [Rhodoblastus acidophilus]MTV33277.1 hypothetical protein [Rhodoblastus acidophilus]